MGTSNSDAVVGVKTVANSRTASMRWRGRVGGRGWGGGAHLVGGGHVLEVLRLVHQGEHPEDGAAGSELVLDCLEDLPAVGRRHPAARWHTNQLGPAVISPASEPWRPAKRSSQSKWLRAVGGHLTASHSQGDGAYLTGRRPGGSSLMTEVVMWLMRVMAMVRGMGVAVMKSTCGGGASGAFFTSCARCRTPKRCCSSMMTSPRLEKSSSALFSAVVPMTMSTSPASSRLRNSRRRLHGR